MSGPANRTAGGLTVSGPAAPPRQNGELMFEAPWESRTFGLAAALVESGVLTWPQMQEALIAEIARWEASDDSTCGPWHYWTCWQRALETLLVELDLLPATAVTERAVHFANRPHGHDH